MYKFICANINKSRNFTSSYRKLVQTKKIHQDNSRPPTSSGTAQLEENADENQEYKDEENTGQENPRPLSSPPRMQRFPITPKLPSFKTISAGPQLKMKGYPKFYTGNCIIVDPPTPSISKKYFHVYSINPPTSTKRPIASITYKNFISDEAKENYKKAMEHLHEIEQKKTADAAGPIANDWLKKYKKKASRAEISYPTHTIKHNLQITKRYKIREGSAERNVQELEDKFKARKRLQMKIFKIAPAKKITYPALVEHLKKGKINAIYARPENRTKPNEIKINTELLTEAMRYRKREEEPKATFEERISPKEECNDIEQDFESLIKSHPTIENASKEVKMKLKTRFIQLLLRSTRTRSAPPTKKVETQLEGSEQIKTEEVDDGNVEENVVTLEGGHEEKPSENLAEEDTQVPISHPQMLKYEVKEKDYMAIRYPKRVLVDDGDVNNYDVEKVCIKETATRTGSGLISDEYGKELPKPNYKNLEHEAQQLSKFLEKFKNLKLKNDNLIKQLKKGKELPENTNMKLQRLKTERLHFIKELEEMDIKFADLETKDHKKKNTLKEKQRAAVKVRNLLTGQPSIKEQAPLNTKAWAEQLEVNKDINDPAGSKKISPIQTLQERKHTEKGQYNMKSEKARHEAMKVSLRESNTPNSSFLLDKKLKSIGKELSEVNTEKRGALVSEKMANSAGGHMYPETYSKTILNVPNKVMTTDILDFREEQHVKKGTDIEDVQEKNRLKFNMVKESIKVRNADYTLNDTRETGTSVTENMASFAGFRDHTSADASNKNSLEKSDKVNISQNFASREEKCSKKALDIKDVQENITPKLNRMKESTKVDNLAYTLGEARETGTEKMANFVGARDHTSAKTYNKKIVNELNKVKVTDNLASREENYANKGTDIRDVHGKNVLKFNRVKGSINLDNIDSALNETSTFVTEKMANSDGTGDYTSARAFSKKTVEPPNAVTATDNLVLREEKFAKKETDIKDMPEKSMPTFNSFKKFTNDNNIGTRLNETKEMGAEQKMAQGKLCATGDAFEERSEFDEMNERASKRERSSRKRKIKEEQRKLREEIKDRTHSVSSIIPTPRNDKVIDRLQEKIIIAEKNKKKVEEIVPEMVSMKQYKEPRRRKPALNNEEKIEKTLDEPSKYDELNQTAEDLVKQKHIPDDKGYTIDQPDAWNDANKPPKQKIQESDLRIEQGEKFNRDLDDFYIKKKQEWGQTQREETQKPIFDHENKGGQKCMGDTCWNESLRKIQEKYQKEKKDIQANMPKMQLLPGNITTFSKEQPKGTLTITEVKKDNNIDSNISKARNTEFKGITDNFKEEHHGFRLYLRNQRVEPGNAQLGPRGQKLGSSGNSSGSPPKDDSDLGMLAEDMTAKDNKTQQCNSKDTTKRPDLPVKNDCVLTKQTQHLIKVIDTALSKRIVSPLQEGVSELKEIQNYKNMGHTGENFNEQLLSKYFESKMLPGSDHAIYMPKERLVVNNISEMDESKSIVEDQLVQKSNADVAVLRPGDEIVILEKNITPATKEQKYDLLNKKGVTKGSDTSDTIVLNKKLLDEALSLRRELAATRSKALEDTSSKIDEIMEKIKGLEKLLKRQQQSVPDEKRSENKPRVTPPKPPIVKDKKNIKKEKPKGPNDMVLPPKIRGSKPEKVPKERSETKQTIANNDHTEIVQSQELKNISGSVQQNFESISHPNMSIKEAKMRKDIPKVAQNTTKKVKSEESSAAIRTISVIHINNDNNEKCLVNESETPGRPGILKDAKYRKPVDKDHYEQLRKHFGETVNQSSNVLKEQQIVRKPTVKFEMKDPTNSTNNKSVEAQRIVLINKKIVRLPKSKSMTTNRAEFSKKEQHVKLNENPSLNNGMKLEKSATQLVTGNRMMAKPFSGKLVSCQSASPSLRVQKGAETLKPLRSNSNEKLNSRASSCPSKTSKFGVEETKTKYSSWSMPGKPGKQVNNSLEYTTVRKKATSKENLTSGISKLFGSDSGQKPVQHTSKQKEESPEDKLSSVKTHVKAKKGEGIFQSKETRSLVDDISQPNPSMLVVGNQNESPRVKPLADMTDSTPEQRNSNLEPNKPLSKSSLTKNEVKQDQHYANSNSKEGEQTSRFEGVFCPLIEERTITTKEPDNNSKKDKLISDLPRKIPHQSLESSELKATSKLVHETVQEEKEASKPKESALQSTREDVGQKQQTSESRTVMPKLFWADKSVQHQSSLMDKESGEEKQVLELFKVRSTADKKVKQKSNSSDSPLTVPKVFRSNKDVPQQPLVIEKPVKPVLELAETVDSNVKREVNSPASCLNAPKVFWVDKDGKRSNEVVKPAKPTLELAQTLSTSLDAKNKAIGHGKQISDSPEFFVTKENLNNNQSLTDQKVLSTADKNVEQKSNESDSPLTAPKVFRANKDVPKQTLVIEKQVKPVLELAKIVDSNEKQETNIPPSRLNVPKVFSGDKDGKQSFLPDEIVKPGKPKVSSTNPEAKDKAIEREEQIADSSEFLVIKKNQSLTDQNSRPVVKIFKDRSNHSSIGNNLGRFSESAKDLEKPVGRGTHTKDQLIRDSPASKVSQKASSTLNNVNQEKQVPEASNLCMADNNLRQDNPVGILNIALPKQLASSKDSGSPAIEGKGSGQKIMLHPNKPKVLRNPKYTGMTDSNSTTNKVSKAGISTTPLSESDEKGFSKGEKQPKGDTIRKAIFRIQYDGEVFIVKKADEQFGEREKKEHHSNHAALGRSTKDHLDMLIRSFESNTNVKETNHSANMKSRNVKEDAVKAKSFMNINRQNNNEARANQTSTVFSASKPVIYIKQHETTKHTSNADSIKKEEVQNAEPKLVAKIKEIIVKPIKENQKEGTKEYESEIKVNISDNAEDNSSYVFQSNLIFPKASLKAKIETIYDKDSMVKIKENRKLENFNRLLVKDISPKKWKPIFWDLGTANFQRIKADFFEHGLNEGRIPQPTIRSDTLIQTKKRKVEKEPSSENIKIITKPQTEEEQCNDTSYLNKKYAKMLNKIEERLASKRKILELKTEQIKLVTSILDATPKSNSPEIANNLRIKPDKTLRQEASKESTKYDDTKRVDLSKKHTKPKCSFNMSKSTQDFEKAGINTAIETKSELKITNNNNDKPHVEMKKSMPEFTENEIDYVGQKNKKIKDVLNQSDLVSDLLRVLTDPIKSGYVHDKINPFKDIPYYGTVKSDCLADSQTVETKKQDKSNSMYTLNVSNNSENKSVNNGAPPAKLYTLEVPKASEAVPRPDNSEVERHDYSLPKSKNLTFKSNKVRPQSAQENKLRKESDKVAVRPKSEATRYRENCLKETRMRRKRGGATSSLKKVAENKPKTQNKSLITKNKDTEPSTSTPGKPMQDPKKVNKAKTEAEIVSIKSKNINSLVPATVATAKSITIKVSKHQSVEKLVSKQNLISEIEAWSSNAKRDVNDRRAESVSDKVRHQDRTKLDSNLPKFKTLSKNLEKIDANANDTAPANKKPLKASQSEHVKTALPRSVCIKSESVDAMKEARHNEHANSNVTLSKNVMPTRAQNTDSKNDRYASREQTDSVKAQPAVQTPLRPPKIRKRLVTVVTKTEETRHRRKEELHWKSKKSRIEQNIKQQEQRSKKDVVEVINAKADYMLRNEEKQRWNEASKASRWHQTYEKDANVIPPNVGPGPWGNKLRKHIKPDDGKKKLHSSASLNHTPSKEKLMSRSEFLRLKRAQSKTNQQTNNQSEQKGLYPMSLKNAEYIRNIQMQLGQQIPIETKPVQIGKEQKPVIEPNSNLHNLGNEIKRYLDETNKKRINSEPNLVQPKSGKDKLKTVLLQNNFANTRPQSSLPKRIEEEIENTIRTRPDLPRPGLSNDTLHFKINEMAKLIANNMKISEEEKQALQTKFVQKDDKKISIKGKGESVNHPQPPSINNLAQANKASEQTNLRNNVETQEDKNIAKQGLLVKAKDSKKIIKSKHIPKKLDMWLD